MHFVRKENHEEPMMKKHAIVESMKSCLPRAIRLPLMVMILLAVVLAPFAGRAMIYYTETFESQAGWTLTGSGLLSHESSGGNPGGLIQLVFSPQAPPTILTGAFTAGAGAHPAFTGDLWSRNDGGGINFSFDFRVDNALPLVLSMGILGNGEEWGYVFTETLTPGVWTNLVVALEYQDGVWIPGNISNDNGAAFIDTMSNVSEFRIYVDTFVGTESVSFSIDNVSTVVPEPGSLALLFAGLAGLRLARRRG
jgi:hypothetical protein